MTSEFLGLSCWTALVMQSLRPTPKKRPAVTKPRHPSEKKGCRCRRYSHAEKNMVADMAHVTSPKTNACPLKRGTIYIYTSIGNTYIWTNHGFFKGDSRWFSGWWNSAVPTTGAPGFSADSLTKVSSELPTETELRQLLQAFPRRSLTGGMFQRYRLKAVLMCFF